MALFPPNASNYCTPASYYKIGTLLIWISKFHAKEFGFAVVYTNQAVSWNKCHSAHVLFSWIRFRELKKAVETLVCRLVFPQHFLFL